MPIEGAMTRTPLVLTCDDTTVTVHPDLGGSIGRWRWRGRDLLRAAHAPASVEDMGCFPLLPFANRIGGGVLPGVGQLALHPGEPNSLHGVGWQDAWSVLDRGEKDARLGLIHRADPRWPFDFTATLTVTLGPDSLVQTLTIRNDDATSMPAGLGFHPFFPVGQGTVLRAAWDGRWETDAAMLPRLHQPLSRPGAVQASGWTVNHCFTGWDGCTVLDYGQYRVSVQADPSCGLLHCYQPESDATFIALEPVTHIPNAHQLHAQGVQGTGLRWLASEESMTSAMTLAMTLNPTTDR
jgi:aldose 1-epimerase